MSISRIDYVMMSAEMLSKYLDLGSLHDLFNKYELMTNHCPYEYISDVQKEVNTFRINENLDVIDNFIMEADACPLTSPTETLCLRCWDAPIDHPFDKEF